MTPSTPRAAGPHYLRDLEVDPLSAAPKALRPGVLRLWGMHGHLLPTPLPIAAAVGVWTGQHGLSLADAERILADATAPAAMGRFRFAADLMTHLAERAAEAVAAASRPAPMTPDGLRAAGLI